MFCYLQIRHGLHFALGKGFILPSIMFLESFLSSPDSTNHVSESVHNWIFVLCHRSGRHLWEWERGTSINGEDQTHTLPLRDYWYGTDGTDMHEITYSTFLLRKHNLPVHDSGLKKISFSFNKTLEKWGKHKCDTRKPKKVAFSNYVRQVFLRVLDSGSFNPCKHTRDLTHGEYNSSSTWDCFLLIQSEQMKTRCWGSGLMGFCF